jgi:hypothetical protein
MSNLNEPIFTEYHKTVLRYLFSILPENDDRRWNIILTKDNVDEIVENVEYPKTLINKINNVLGYFATHTDFFGKEIKVSMRKLYRITFCVDEKELSNILKYLENQEFIKNNANTFNITPGEYNYTVQVEGLKYYQNLMQTKPQTTQAFVAMWFNSKEISERYEPNMQKIYIDVIKPAIEYENRFAPIKIDNIEHCGDINDEMISQIRKSRFMVADLTGYRGGVYWEAGFAEGIGIPVIYTCHEQWLNSNLDFKIEGVHFDLNHRNIILWNEKNLEDFKRKLTNRISAIIT